MIDLFIDNLNRFLSKKNLKNRICKKDYTKGITMNEYFKPIEPYNIFKLKVSNIHTIHVEESGNQRESL